MDKSIVNEVVSALEAVKAADPLSNRSVRINSLPRALPKQKSCRSGPARTAQDVNGSFANEAPVVGRDRFLKSRNRATWGVSILLFYINDVDVRQNRHPGARRPNIGHSAEQSAKICAVRRVPNPIAFARRCRHRAGRDRRDRHRKIRPGRA